MHRVKRRRTLLVAIAVALVAASSAFAAWVILTGGSGQTGGSFASASQSSAVSFQQPIDAAITTACTGWASLYGGNPPCSGSGGTSPLALAPGVATDLFIGVKNLSGVSESITYDKTKFVIATSPDTSCASHLSIDALGASNTFITGLVPAAQDTSAGWYSDGNGGVIQGFKLALHADSSLPNSCASGSYTITIPSSAVTTNP